MILPGPIGEIIATLHFILNIIGKIAEEVYASLAFKFINADGICFGVIPIQRMFKSIAVVITMFHLKTYGLIGCSYVNGLIGTMSQYGNEVILWNRQSF